MSIECIHCSEDNDEQASHCINCGSKLSANPSSAKSHSPTATTDNCASSHKGEKQAQPINDGCCEEPRLVLSLIGQPVDIEISQCGGSLGRCGDIKPEFFVDHQYLSRNHCQFYYENGIWKVENLSHSNTTEINGVFLMHNIRHTVREGDLLRLANLIFRVGVIEAVSQNSVSDSVSNSTDSSEYLESIQWIIECPECKKRYEVASSHDRIEVCDACEDDFGKFEIAKIEPKRVVNRTRVGKTNDD